MCRARPRDARWTTSTWRRGRPENVSCCYHCCCSMSFLCGESDCDWQWDGPHCQVPFSSIRGFSACFDSCALSTAKKQCHRKTYQFVRCCLLINMHDCNSSAQLETRPYPEVECPKFAGTAHCNNKRMTSSSWDLTLPSRIFLPICPLLKEVFSSMIVQVETCLKPLSYSNPAWSWHSNHRLRSGKKRSPQRLHRSGSAKTYDSDQIILASHRKVPMFSFFHISWSKPLSLRQ